MMYFIGLDGECRVTAYIEAGKNPNENLWIDSPWEIPPDDYDDWLYIDGALVHHPRNLPPVQYSAQEVLTALFAHEPEIMESIPDSDLCHMAEYMQPWGVGVDYSVGDLCRYDSLAYRCVQSHRSQASWTPSDAHSLWSRVGEGDIPEWIQPTGAHDAYSKGDKVRHNGSVWVSDIDANTYEPGIYGWTAE